MACVAEESPKVELKVPSEEVIKSFVTTAKDKPGSKTSYQFNATFKSGSKDPFRFGGKITFAISVALQKKTETDAGETEDSVFGETVNIVVVDSDGKMVAQKQEDLSALCPS